MFTTKHAGSIHFGTPMPSLAAAQSQSACINLWCGFPKFPRETLLAIIADAAVDIPMPRFLHSSSPIDIPVPDADESLEVDFYINLDFILILIFRF